MPDRGGEGSLAPYNLYAIYMHVAYQDFSMRNQRLPEAVAAYEEALSVLNRVLGSKHLRTRILKAELAHLKKRIPREAKRSQ